MYETIFITVQAAIAVVCWLIVAGGAGLAVFARSIRDTMLECFALCAVSLTAIGAACRIISQGWVSDDGAALSMALAGYVAAMAYKHVRGIQ